MPTTAIGRAYVLSGQLNDEVSRARRDWRQIAADSAELERIALIEARGGSVPNGTRSTTA